MYKYVNMKELIGKTFYKVENIANDCVVFKNESGRYELKHVQDCCEEVYIEDICGDLNDLIGNEILDAYESFSNQNPDGEYACYNGNYSCTWSFYTIRTIKGTVTIRFYGESNGYYSEEAELMFYPKTEVNNG